MNKLFTKIGVACVGLAMVVGVGVAVGRDGAVEANAYVGTTFELYSGALTEGDYIIYYDGKAMNTTVSSNRLQYAEVSPSANIITTTNTAIVWHIAPSGNNWTLYNEASNKYAASTGAEKKAQMLADGTDDKSIWIVEEDDGTYEFTNKYNSEHSIKAALRNNTTYGFACYATATGGFLSLYKSHYSEAKTFETKYVKKPGGTEIAYPAETPTGTATTNCLSTSKGGLGYYDSAMTAYGLLTTNAKKAFATHADYANARTRLIAWAAANEIILVFNSDGSTTTTPISGSARFGVAPQSNNAATVIIIISGVALTALVGTLFLIRRKKEEK